MKWPHLLWMMPIKVLVLPWRIGRAVGGQFAWHSVLLWWPVSSFGLVTWSQIPGQDVRMDPSLFNCYHYWSTLAVDLTSANLGKVQLLLFEARLKWFNLGVQLGIDDTTLNSIKMKYPSDADNCFKEMLCHWLKMDPPPTWDRLLSALESDVIGLCNLACDIRKKFDDINGDHSTPMLVQSGNNCSFSSP